MRPAALASLVVALHGCTLVEGYPGALREDTPALCHNGLDDDANGTSDCLDPSCVGLCPEETPEECGDGLDQDEDGLVDDADPSCWPEAPTTIGRCVEQEGGDWTATFGAGDGWLAFGGDAHYVRDVTGVFTTDVIALPVAPAPTLAGVRNAATVTGSIDDLVATASVYLPVGGTTQIGVELTTPTIAPVGAPDSIGLLLSGGSLAGTYRVDGQAHATSANATFPAGWYDVRLEVHPARITVSARAVDGSASSSVDVPIQHVLGGEAPLAMSVSQQGGDGTLLGAASLSRGFVRPCGNAVQVPPGDATQAAVTSLLLAAASDGTALCVLGQTGATTVSSFRSDDGGITFGPQVSVPVGTATEAEHCATLTWDPARASFAGIAWVHGLDGSRTATLLTSADCRVWETVDAPALADASLSCATYSIVPGVHGAAPTHELWKLLPGTLGTIVLQRHWSPTPFAPDVAPASDPSPLRAAAAPGVTYPWLLSPPVHAFAGDLLAMVTLDSRTHVVVIDRALASARDWIELAPSGIAGACDAALVSSPHLYFTGPSRGGAAHSCDPTREAGGPTVVRPFSVASR